MVGPRMGRGYVRAGRWNEFLEILTGRRTALYQEHSEKLLQSGHAYRCFCSSEKLNDLARRRASLGLPTDYDRTCEGISAEESLGRASSREAFVVRLRVPQKPPEFVDLVYGSVGKPNHNKKARNLGEALYEDPVLLKSDGLPTYHLANVVDDHHMRITHVVRAAPPEFAHVGLLQDSSHQKFSKRKDDLNIRSFDEQGIFPEALLNYVALYGWSHTRNSDVMRLVDLVNSFDLKFTKGNTVVEPHKLMYLQKKYAAMYADENGPQFEALIDNVFRTFEQEFKTPIWHPDQVYPNHLKGHALKTRIAGVLRHTAKNYTTPRTMLDNYRYFFYSVPLPPEDCTNGIKLENLPPDGWTDDGLKIEIAAIVDALGSALEKASKEVYTIVQFYLRWAIARGGSGPPMHTTMALLGREICLHRLEEAAAILRARSKEDNTSAGSQE
ncbi:MAG: hypothetical protein Q9219_003619 [cf. Caloplaca sp. 3 TL-2023]